MIAPLAMAGIMAGGNALMGAKGGRQAAQAANQPRTTSGWRQLDPYDQQGLDSMINRINQTYDPANMPDLTPRNQQDLYGRMYNQVYGGGGGGGQGPGPGGGGGGGGGGTQGGGRRGRGGRGGGGGRGGWRADLQHLQQNYDPSYAQDYRQSVLQGDYLDLESNPYFQQRADEVQRRLSEENARGLTQSLSPFMAGGGGVGGGALASQMQLANERGSQNMSDQMNSLYLGQYNQERSMQQEAANMEAQLTQQYVNAGASLANAQRAARAQVRSAQIGAAAQRYAADQARAAAGANTALAREQFGWGQQMDLAGLAGSLDRSANQQAMLPFGMTQDYAGLMMPIQTGFGRQNYNETSRGPQYNTGQAMGQGLLGGAMQGLGMAGQMGWNPFG